MRNKFVTTNFEKYLNRAHITHLVTVNHVAGAVILGSWLGLAYY